MASKRPIAVFKAPKPIDKYIFKVRALIINLLANPGYFSGVSPSPATVTTNVGNLELKQGRVVAKKVGAAALRDVQLKRVKANVNDLIAEVQSLADNSDNEETAIAIIQAAGLGVKVNGVRIKAPFEVKCKKGFSGIAFLRMKKVLGASYDWQVSYNKGKTWVPLPGTKPANTQLENITPGSKLLFRGRANVGHVAGEWKTEELIVV